MGIKIFTALSIFIGLCCWFLTKNELGFALGAGVFWCGAIASSTLGTDKKIKKDSII